MFRVTPYLYKSTPETVVNTVKNAAKAVADTIQGGGAAAAKETNKAELKSEDSTVGQKVDAAGSAISNKAKETASDASAEMNKQKAKHS